MWELFKFAWDIVVLRDGIRKGQINWARGIFAACFAILLYAIALPAVLYYDKHPSFQPWFLAAMALDGVLFLAFMAIAIRWYLQSLAAKKSPAASEIPNES